MLIKKHEIWTLVIGQLCILTRCVMVQFSQLAVGIILPYVPAATGSQSATSVCHLILLTHIFHPHTVCMYFLCNSLKKDKINGVCSSHKINGIYHSLVTSFFAVYLLTFSFDVTILNIQYMHHLSTLLYINSALTSLITSSIGKEGTYHTM